MLHSVIMAGGTGTRLWPASRAARPKQFLAFHQDKTMLAVTIERVASLIPHERTLVVTADSMIPLVQETAPFLSPSQILGETAPRNTAPCIGWAAVELLRADANATMAVFSSDHIVTPENLFCDTLSYAEKLVEEDANRLVTIGISPTFAATSYGYIQCGAPLKTNVAQSLQCSQSSQGTQIAAQQVTRFHEKPPQHLAEEFVQAGNFRWNAGIFVWKAATILRLINEYEPQIGELLTKISEDRTSAATLFPQMKKISIDYAVLERAENVVVLDAPFLWDDVGTWRSLERTEAQARDAAENLILGVHSVTIDAQRNIIHSSRTQENIIALLGVDDLIVIQTDNATLIARKDQEERVREVIEKIKTEGLEKFL